MASQAMPPSTKKEYTFTTKFYPPLHLSTSKPTTQLYPTPQNPNPATNNPIFTDAMHIRHAVFVQEQHCRAEEEIDDDDARSWGWVVYVHRQGNNQQQDTEGGDGDGGEAVGTIRLVPPPHISHHHLTGSSAPEEKKKVRHDYDHEPYIKITRVAVLASFRGYGLSRLLMRTVEDWAANNKAVIDEMYSQFAQNHMPERGGGGGGGREEWNGLIGLHAQVQVERMYAAMGYVTDEAMGRWHEEGIEHLGMFKRVAVF
ncbi:Acyl-CoA N-acyltransferase [Penicillium occitanis (nom. inval.)]|nr:Acyl-CoA N-acyltransferase [Penicillium occitanis (nom. inval.)]PCH09672.1 hypothetical protein PENOC_009000 [Penicillium occitanis (nom. inval.)]